MNGPKLQAPLAPLEIPEEADVDPGPGRILVRLAPSAPEGKYGSLILPSMQGDRQFYGRVEKLPTAYEDDELMKDQLNWLQEGDLVFFGKYSGTELNINRERYIICRETDILARVRSRPKLVEE